MATYKTDFATAQDNVGITRQLNPSARDTTQETNVAVFTFTLTAALVAGDILKLGKLNIDNVVVIPESCKIVGSSGTAKFNAKLQSVTAGATAVDESLAATYDGTGGTKYIALARLASGLNTSLVAGTADNAGGTTGSYLQLLIATVASFNGGAIGDTLQIEIAYRSRLSY
jgi:hypothetical protein